MSQTAQTAAQKVPEVQRIRGPEIKVFIKYSEGVPFVKALERADAENRVLVSNKRHDKALVGSDEWKNHSEVYPCWTGTMAGYEKPGKKLGDTIVYVDPETKQRYVFPTGDAKGEANVLLAVNHPDFKLGYDGKDLVVLPEAGKVEMVSDFPTKDGWYVTDAKYGISTGKETSSNNSEARYLYRVDDAGRVGPVARVYDYLGCNGRRVVLLDYRPSFRIGVAVESVGGPTNASHQKVAVEEVARGAGASQLEAAKLRITREGQRIVVEGTSEQLDAVMKTLEQLKQ